MKKYFTLEEALAEYKRAPDKYELGFTRADFGFTRGLYEGMRAYFGFKPRNYAMRLEQEYKVKGK